ncbi:signal transduction histidine kinase [alpha proteobacterium U9-1i]|nr:signal transduction histidine kinase [alpha proteobacterium U9-1i]
MKLYQHACAEAQVGVYEQDADCQLTYVSENLQRALREVLQRGDIEFLGKDPREIFLFNTAGPGRADLLKEHAQSGGKPVTFEFRLTDRDGRDIWFKGRELVTYGTNGAFLGCKGVFIVITRRKAAEAASQAKSRFMTAISHELRTPLNAIIGYAELIAEEELLKSEGDGARYLERVHSAAGHLLALIDEVLMFTDLENASGAAIPERLGIENFCRSIIGEFTAAAQARANILV